MVFQWCFCPSKWCNLQVFWFNFYWCQIVAEIWQPCIQCNFCMPTLVLEGAVGMDRISGHFLYPLSGLISISVSDKNTVSSQISGTLAVTWPDIKYIAG